MKMLKNFKILTTITMFGSLTLLGGCAGNVSPNTYDVCEAGVASKVEPGIIIGKRKINIDGNTGMGGLAGVAAGAAGGSAIGGDARTNVLGAIGGAVIGGVVGNAVDKGVNKHQGYEYIIRLRSGSTISVAQARDLQFQMNQPVLVIYGPTTRIVPDESCGGDYYPPPRAEQRGKNYYYQG